MFSLCFFTPEQQAISSNAIHSNAISSNAIHSNAISSNAISSNAISSNANSNEERKPPPALKKGECEEGRRRGARAEAIMQRYVI